MMNLFWRMMVLAGAAVFMSVAAHGEPPASYKLVWSDEFDGAALDASKWVCWLPGKRHDAMNTADAISVTNGCLAIMSYQADGTNYTGMVSTRDKFMPVRGYWEARIEFHESSGMWSAFWLQSPTMGRPPDDPVKAGMEIDIIEHRLVAKNGGHIDGTVQHTLHWNGYGKYHQSTNHATIDDKLKTGFHVYGFEWTESEYKFYVDGKVTWTVNEPISKSPEFLILSSEIHDASWAGYIPKDGYGDRTTSRTKLIVDYVRYYKRE